jgi:hypothetical protein
MSQVKISGNASGTGIFTIASPSGNTDRTLTLPDATGTFLTSGGAISGSTGSFTGDLSFNSGYGSAAVAYGCRAWVNFNGTGTVAIRASGNVSSITDNGVGNYTVNFTSAMPDLNYATVGSAWYSGVTGILFSIESTPSSTTSKSINTNNPGATSNSDATYISVAIFR